MFLVSKLCDARSSRSSSERTHMASVPPDKSCNSFNWRRYVCFHSMHHARIHVRDFPSNLRLLSFSSTHPRARSTHPALVQLFTISASSDSKPGNDNDSLLARLFPPHPSPSIPSSPNALDASNVLIEALADPSRTRIQRFARPLGGITVALAIFVLGIGECFVLCLPVSLSFGMTTHWYCWILRGRGRDRDFTRQSSPTAYCITIPFVFSTDPTSAVLTFPPSPRLIK